MFLIWQASGTVKYFSRGPKIRPLASEVYSRGAEHSENRPEGGKQHERKVFIAYDREAYAAADGGELRITFDTALRARSNDVDLRLGDHGAPLLPGGLYLMEIKIPGTTPPWLARLLADNRIFSTSFSKYGAYYKEFVLGGKSAVIQKEVLLSA